MKREGRIVIEIESPVLIKDPTLYNTDLVATIRDWTTGLPYIPAGVIVQVLRKSADMLCLNERAEAIKTRLFGTRDTQGMLWLGHATYNGIPLATQTRVITSNRHIFLDDSWDALTSAVQVWYKDGRRTIRGIAPGSTMAAPLQWLDTPDQNDLDFLTATCAGIRTIGQKADQGLGRVTVSVEDTEFSNQNLNFLRG